MNTRLLFHYVLVVCIGIGCSIAALAQSYRSEATLSPNFSLGIPALKAEGKFYQVSLNYQAPIWTLKSAVEIATIDSDYATGSYGNDALDLKCVYYGGSYYSARLASIAPNAHSFTLASFTKLVSCPLPPAIGPARGQWVRTADSPLSARNYAALAWTGKEILVFGGQQFFCPATASCIAPTTPPLRDGAAYNPLTDSWRKIADAPAGIAGNTVTAGTDIYVFAQTSYTSPLRLLRYRSTQDRWDELDPPVNPTGMSIAAFGSDIVLYPYEDKTGSTPDWLFDSATNQWSQLPDSPLGPAFSRQYVALGHDLYLFDHALTPSPGGADGPSYLRAARFRAQQWKLLPVADSIGSAPDLIAGRRLIAPALGCADGGTVNGYGRCVPYGAVFDTETDTWQALPNAPGLGLKYFESAGGFSESDFKLRKTGLPTLDATTDQWFLFPQLDADLNTQRSLRATGPYGFAFGGANATGVLLKDAWIWKP